MASFRADEFLPSLVLYLVPMVLSLTVHEYAHALVATRLGDDTPAREERLTLSPLAHVDLFGTLIVPVVSILTVGYAFIGWAKPVNINPVRFRRGVTMRGGMTLASVAGPLSNLLLAVVSVALLAGLQRAGWLDGSTRTREAVARLLSASFMVNTGLCVFNLLPIPPLDGHRLLPASLDPLVERIRPFSFVLVLVVLSVPALRGVLIDWPMKTLQSAVLSVFGALFAR